VQAVQNGPYAPIYVTSGSQREGAGG